MDEVIVILLFIILLLLLLSFLSLQLLIKAFSLFADAFEEMEDAKSDSICKILDKLNRIDYEKSKSNH